MDILNLEFIAALPENQQSLYTGVAYDGEYFYLTLPERNLICVMDHQFHLIREHRVAKPYGAICYHDRKKCFYVADTRDSEYIYQLNSNLEEMNYFCISEHKERSSKIINIACNSYHDTFMVVFKESIIEVTENGDLKRIIKEGNNTTYCCVLNIASYTIVIVSTHSQQYLFLFAGNGCLIKQFCIPNEFDIKDLVFTMNTESQTLEFLLLASQCSCQPCILRCIMNIENCSCGCCDMTDNCCCIPCIEQSICDIIESIALQETALSHILNAEGEKIQSAVKIAQNVCELIEIDKSVNTTITNVILLENVLYAKLSAIQNLCLPQCDQDCW